MSIRKAAVPALCLLALVSAGCGGSPDPPPAPAPKPSPPPASDKDAAKKTMKSYIGALAGGDGEKACSYLTGAAKRQVVSQARALNPSLGAASCAETLKQLAKTMPAGMAKKLTEVEIKVQVRGDSATVGAAGGPGTYDGQLRKIDGKWLISKFASL